jgi:hypothetical protein
MTPKAPASSDPPRATIRDLIDALTRYVNLRLASYGARQLAFGTPLWDRIRSELQSSEKTVRTTLRLSLAEIHRKQDGIALGAGVLAYLDAPETGPSWIACQARDKERADVIRNKLKLGEMLESPEMASLGEKRDDQCEAAAQRLIEAMRASPSAADLSAAWVRNDAEVDAALAECEKARASLRDASIPGIDAASESPVQSRDRQWKTDMESGEGPRSELARECRWFSTWARKHPEPSIEGLTALRSMLYQTGDVMGETAVRLLATHPAVARKVSRALAEIRAAVPDNNGKRRQTPSRDAWKQIFAVVGRYESILRQCWHELCDADKAAGDASPSPQTGSNGDSIGGKQNGSHKNLDGYRDAKWIREATQGGLTGDALRKMVKRGTLKDTVPGSNGRRLFNVEELAAARPTHGAALRDALSECADFRKPRKAEKERLTKPDKGGQTTTNADK